ncbi:hypothetical protein [Apilactobacillus xinyiensis]|uniref:hypothetical protein n=1 Tax=Apilactobacillus xinyiensis TaxID=2841032 RepID=UPI00200E64DD|nr:hypothetical protein [Apilactobacillus xinyiensis]MCL0319394.1 hypothetical protein [Apilactobacillus xinyiensis]
MINIPIVRPSQENEYMISKWINIGEQSYMYWSVRRYDDDNYEEDNVNDTFKCILSLKKENENLKAINAKNMADNTKNSMMLAKLLSEQAKQNLINKG